MFLNNKNKNSFSFLRKVINFLWQTFMFNILRINKSFQEFIVFHIIFVYIHFCYMCIIIVDTRYFIRDLYCFHFFFTKERNKH